MASGSRKRSKSASIKNLSTGVVRIIGGRWRGRKLPVANSEGLRPTTDRVRETVFNWLQFELTGTHVLDLFSGSGVLAFEALSRGATHATLIEKNKAISHQLRANISKLEASASVVNDDALIWLTQTTVTPQQVVFIDPPYQCGLVAPALQTLHRRGWLAENAWVLIESEAVAVVDWQAAIPETWRLHRELKAGQANIYLYEASSKDD